MPLPTDITKEVGEVQSKEREAGFPELRELKGADIIKKVPHPRNLMNPFLNPLLRVLCYPCTLALLNAEGVGSFAKGSHFFTFRESFGPVGSICRVGILRYPEALRRYISTQCIGNLFMKT
jgi:hypothetical protein